MQLGQLLLTKEQQNIPHDKLIAISLTLKKLKKDNLATQILLTDGIVNAKDGTFVSLKEQAQANIEIGLSLYAKKDYPQAIVKLREAEIMFPKHIGIKLNLLQVLLVSIEENDRGNKNLDRAKKLLVDVGGLKLTTEESERLKKMQKKYQLVAGI